MARRKRKAPDGEEGVTPGIPVEDEVSEGDEPAAEPVPESEIKSKSESETETGPEQESGEADTASESGGEDEAAEEEEESESTAEGVENPEPEEKPEDESEPETTEDSESGDEEESGDGEDGDGEEGEEEGAEDGEDEVGEDGASSLSFPMASVVEALLFAAREPLKLAQIARAVGRRTRHDAVRQAIEELNVHYLETSRAFEIAEISGRYQLMSRPEYAEHIMRIYPKRELTEKDGKSQRLTPAMLDTLAIIAYKQPVMRSEIDHIRGVSCANALRALIERGSVREVGRRTDLVGKPGVFGTTERFLAEFGLGSLDELPMRSEFIEPGGPPPVEMTISAGDAPEEASGSAEEEGGADSSDADAKPSFTLIGAEDGSEDETDDEASGEEESDDVQDADSAIEEEGEDEEEEADEDEEEDEEEEEDGEFAEEDPDEEEQEEAESDEEAYAEEEGAEEEEEEEEDDAEEDLPE